MSVHHCIDSTAAGDYSVLEFRIVMVYLVYVTWYLIYWCVCLLPGLVSMNVCVFVGEGLRGSFAKPNPFVGY